MVQRNQSFHLGVVHWMFIFLIAVPPGLFAFISARLGLGILIQALALLLVLLVSLIQNGGVFRFPLIPTASVLALMVAYYLMPRYFDAFDPGGKSRETLGILANVLFYYILVFQVVASSPKSSHTIVLIENAVAVAALGTASLLIFQYYGLFGGHDGELSYAGFGHRIHSGIFCAIGLFVLVKKFLSSKYRMSQRVLLGLTALLLLVVCVMAASRSVMVVVILAFYFAGIASSGLKNIARVTVLVMLFVASIMFYGPAAEKFLQSDFSSGRIDLWQQLAPSTLGEAIYGRGVGYMWSLNQFDISEYGGYVSESNESIYAHNDYLFFIVELGVLGVIFWVTFLLYHLMEAILFRSDSRAGGQPRTSRASLAFIAVSVLIVETADTVIFGGRNIYYIAILLALYFCQLRSIAPHK